MFWNLVAESICNRVTSEKPLGVGGVRDFLAQETMTPNPC